LQGSTEEIPAEDHRWRGRIPFAFLAAVALFFLMDSLLWRSERWLRFVDRYAPHWRSDSLVTAAIRLLPRDEVAPPILLLGSSQIREGLDCRAFERRLPGRTCRNLAVSAGAPTDLLYLTRRLDARVSRRTIVTSIFPRTLNQEPKTYFTDLATIGELVRGGASSEMSFRQWLDLGEALAMNVSETLRNKDALWAIWAGVRGRVAEAWNLSLPAPGRRRGRLLKEPPAYFERVLAGSHRPLPRTFVAAQAAALDTLIVRERSLGNRILLVEFPTRAGFETTVSALNLERYRAVVESLAARSDVVFIRRDQLPPLALEDWNDFTHLADSGMEKVSARLSEILAREESR
jgi:hypothetical protein